LANTISAFFKLATLRSALFRLASSRFKSVVEMGKEKKDNPLPENEGVVPERIVELRRELKRGQVREGVF
jgi:chorismate mutase